MDEMDFILDEVSNAGPRTAAAELTGWEVVVFELADEDELPE